MWRATLGLDSPRKLASPVDQRTALAGWQRAMHRHAATDPIHSHMSESRRAHYRVTYPMAERPSFEMGRNRYEVVQCSERGLRYEVPDSRFPALGSEVGGVIQFRRGTRVEVVGEVTRAHSGEAVLFLRMRGIPFSEMLLEQQYLRSKGYTLVD